MNEKSIIKICVSVTLAFIIFCLHIIAILILFNEYIAFIIGAFEIRMFVKVMNTENKYVKAYFKWLER